MMLRLLFVCMVCLAACSKSKIPKGILGPEKMQAVYWDYIRADVYAREFIISDSTKNTAIENAKLQLQVFKLHKVSREDFYKSYDFYLEHKDMMKDMLDTMLVRHKITDTAAGTRNRTTVVNDSNNIQNNKKRSRLLPSFRKLDSVNVAE